MRALRSIRPGGAALLSAAVLFLSPPSLVGQDSTPLEPPLVGDLPPAPEEVFIPTPEGISVAPYATDFGVIWSLDFAPDGRLFIAEREGRIHVVSPEGRLDPEPWLTLDEIEVRLEDGLLGMVLHPDFANEPWVYVFHTAPKGGELVNRISRFRDVGGRASDQEILVDDLPAHRIHNGGRLRFGPDGMLYVSTGDVGEPMAAQDLGQLGGKILRFTPEGGVPADNPWPGTPLWAIGLRNTHGLAFRPGDGTLFAADNGPTAEWGPLRIGARDELNRVPPGGNLGWPLAVGAPGDDRFVDPLLAWDPAHPPGDLVFYDGELMPELKGDLFYSGLRSQTLMRIRFQDPDDPDRVTAIERWFTEEEGPSVHGRLRALAVGPDGALYVGTTNQDGRSPLREGDDQVLRIAPTR